MIESYLENKELDRRFRVLGVEHTAIFNKQCWVGIIEKVTELKKVRKMAMWIFQREEYSQCKTP